MSWNETYVPLSSPHLLDVLHAFFFIILAPGSLGIDFTGKAKTLK